MRMHDRQFDLGSHSADILWATYDGYDDGKYQIYCMFILH